MAKKAYIFFAIFQGDAHALYPSLDPHIEMAIALHISKSKQTFSKWFNTMYFY